ncbi:MAG: hypothetical protein R3B70_34355 [Polyangiaceae bacterium]
MRRFAWTRLGGATGRVSPFSGVLVAGLVGALSASAGVGAAALSLIL